MDGARVDGRASGPPLKALAVLALGVLGTSWSAIFVRWANVPGGTSAFYRVLIAEVALVAFLALRRRPVTFQRRGLWLGAMGGVFLGVDLALYNAAVLLSPVNNVTLLCNNTPVFVGLLSWIFLRRRPLRSYWVGLVFAGIGSILIVGPDLVRHVTLGAVDLMSLGASVCFAAFLLFTQLARAQLDSHTVLAISLAGSAVFLYIFDLVAGVSLKVSDAHSWLALIGLGLVTQTFAYLALTYALGHLPATVTSVGLLTQLPVTAVLVFLLLGESMTGWQLTGGGFVLFGVWTASR